MSDVKAFFEENGYYLARGVYSPAEIAELEEDFDRIVAQLQSSGEDINARWNSSIMKDLKVEDSVVVHTHNVQVYSSRWFKAIQQEKFLDIASDILGPDVILHHTKLFQKPAEKGAPFPMHQDWTYFPSVKDSLIAGIIHVSEATDAMGCVRVYPGSHRLGRVDGTNGQVANDLLEKYPIDGATILEAEPGDVLFFHYFTLHGSMPNRSNKVRKTVLVQMYAGDDEIDPSRSGHNNARIALRGWNYRAGRSTANQAN